MSSSEEPGWFRLEIADAEGNLRTTCHEFHADQHNVSSTVYQVNNCLVPPNKDVVALADMRMIFSFKAEAAAGDLLESEECVINLPITLIRESDGVIFERDISLEQMTGFKISGAVDIQTNSNNFTILCYWPIPEGYRGFWGKDTLGTSHGYVYLGDND